MDLRLTPVGMQADYAVNAPHAAGTALTHGSRRRAVLGAGYRDR